MQESPSRYYGHFERHVWFRLSDLSNYPFNLATPTISTQENNVGDRPLPPLPPLRWQKLSVTPDIGQRYGITHVTDCYGMREFEETTGRKLNSRGSPPGPGRANIQATSADKVNK